MKAKKTKKKDQQEQVTELFEEMCECIKDMTVRIGNPTRVPPMPGPELEDPPSPPTFTEDFSLEVEALKAQVRTHVNGKGLEVVEAALGQLLEELAFLRRRANPRRYNTRRRRTLDY